MVVAAGFYGFKKFDVMGKSCEADKINAQVEKRLAKADVLREGRVILRHVSEYIRLDKIPASKRDETIRANFELNIRKERACSVSQALTQRAIPQ